MFPKKPIFAIILLFPLLYLLFFLSPTGFSAEKNRLVIPLQATPEDIVTLLKQGNLIRSGGVFSFILKVIYFGKTVEPGAYQLSHNMTALKVADTLINHPYQKWITLIPGLRKEQVAQKIQEKFSWDKAKTEDFLENAKEGYLFPDTYLLNVDYTGQEMAQRLMNRLQEVFDAKMQNYLLSQNIRNDTAIKIASLIERESGSESDKSLIAGIIWNRLNTGMKLQIDATIQYALGKSGDWWPKVSGQDMKVDSLYNTYLYKGLPPAPIANPSLASIKGAVYPEETDCLFYLHDSQKQIHCAETYQEHLENIENYLK